ncbi:MAG: transposase [Gammaproteobacteria bacterium]|nr:transposase [Gammaproteobacteria bacterium]
MNRGRGRQKIFHGQEYYEEFLCTLEEAHKRFGVEIQCYCLMSNHYHLLIKTPEGNLGRAMRHISGVYTQRHNRLRKTDGPLFRGRYKAILIEEDSYQLQLSRYIHRNPLEAKIVSNLKDYPWSSYQYYAMKRAYPAWLYPQEVLDQLQVKAKVHARYRAFIELGIDEEIKQFYNKGNMAPYLGSEVFRSWAYDQREKEGGEVTEKEKYHFKPDMDKLIKQVSVVFEVTVKSILTGKRGSTNHPRWIAMYVCQEQGDHRLIDIARKFGLKRSGSVASIITKLKKMLQADKKLAARINKSI